jgi:hypothetical protein
LVNYIKKRDYFRQLLKGSDLNSCLCEGNLSSGHCEAISNENDVDFANDLLWRGASYFYFYADGKTEINSVLPKTLTTLEEAAKRLCAKIGIEIYFIMRAYLFYYIYKKII